MALKMVFEELSNLTDVIISLSQDTYCDCALIMCFWILYYGFNFVPFCMYVLKEEWGCKKKRGCQPTCVLYHTVKTSLIRKEY